jgi:hypothetical protein
MSNVAFASASGRTGAPLTSRQRRWQRYQQSRRVSSLLSSSSSSSFLLEKHKLRRPHDVVARGTKGDEDESFDEENVVVDGERLDAERGEKDYSETESASASSSAASSPPTAFKSDTTKRTGTSDEEKNEGEEKDGFDGKKKEKMENDDTSKNEKIKNALAQTKTFALNLPFISHVRVFLDRKSKWEKLYGEANEKFADHKKQDELMLELHRFGRVEEIIERFE